MKIIDMRVRAPFAPYKNSFYTEAGLKNLEFESMRRLNAPLAQSAKHYSMELLQKEAEEANIEKMVVPVRKNVGGKNEDLVTLIQNYPDKIVGLPGVTVENISGAVQEIEELVLNGPCHGIIMEPAMDITPWYVNEEKLFPIYEYCQEHDVPIFFTFGGIFCKSLRYYNPETLDDIAGAFPKLKIGLAHGGWPYVTEVSQIALNRGNVYIAPDFYMIESPGMNDYIAAASVLLSNRVMFSSAYPIMPMKEAAEYYMQSGIRESALPKVMYENAREFLNL